MKNYSKPVAVLFFLFLLQACGTNTNEKQTAVDFEIPSEKFALDNGLEVIFHIDRSDPVVAVALTAHVGSAREKAGRTGFAHLFEHLLFLESENLGKGGLDKMSARIGGSGANGSTSRDRTNYFQTVPKDALEKMIWAEADKLGWFINTVTDPVLAKEKQVVKNEKRQSVDNRPYGHNRYVIDKALYPEDHPYNWQVIGSLEDLQNATVDDVKEFFKRWYVPNNVTLVISGDFEVAQAKEWVHKYFDEIPRGQDVDPLPKRAGSVEETIKLYHEDNFARVPQLTMTWPTVEQYHPDSYPLTVLCRYLAQGKEAPLYKVLVEEKKLTSAVSMFNFSSELAGSANLSVRTFSGKDLNDVESAINEAFANFEANGFPEADLNRIKAGQETTFYNGLSSVLGKGFQLAQYNIFAGDPNFVSQDIKNILAVTVEDVQLVYEKYIKGKNFIATSFVPKGQLDLALRGSEKAEVVEEQIVQGAEEEFDASIQATYEPTPSTFDRSIEPPYGEKFDISLPEVWQGSLQNGLSVYGIQSNEVPLVQFNIVIKGGQSVESSDQLGVANFTANMMTKGTASKTPAEFEAAVQQLGATLRVTAGRESTRITGTTLAKNYAKLMELVEEVLLTPRWDEKEFELTKEAIIGQLTQQKANPNAIATNAFNLILYGKENIRSQNTRGTISSINQISLSDLKAYYEAYLSPSIAQMHIVGSLTQSEVLEGLSRLENNWKARKVTLPTVIEADKISQSKVYFYDVPGAKQSVLRIGYPALAATDEEFYPAFVSNYILGGGGFASRLTQQLREGKGYTYGIGSGFNGTVNKGVFSIGSGVRTNVTLESLQEIKKILDDYPTTFTDKDLATTKGFLSKSNARSFETANAKLGILENISRYNWQPSYINERRQIVEQMTVEQIQALSEKYYNTDQMIWLVVGDKATQMDRLKALGFGDPILINDQLADDDPVILK